MSKNLLFKGGITIMIVGSVALTCMCEYAAKQWGKAERELEKAKDAIIAEGLLIASLIDKNEKLNNELNELKAKRK